MKLWLIERHGRCDYDEHDAAVIRADSEEEARRIAAKDMIPKNIWLSATESSCVPLAFEGEDKIIVSSFNAG